MPQSTGVLEKTIPKQLTEMQSTDARGRVLWKSILPSKNLSWENHTNFSFPDVMPSEVELALQQMVKDRPTGLGNITINFISCTPIWFWIVIRRVSKTKYKTNITMGQYVGQGSVLLSQQFWIYLQETHWFQRFLMFLVQTLRRRDLSTTSIDNLDLLVPTAGEGMKHTLEIMG